MSLRTWYLRQSPVVQAGLIFLAFSPIELACGYLLHNTAIASNASHDAFDGVFFIGGGIIDDRLRLSPRHSIHCTARGLYSITVGLSAVAVVATGLVLGGSNSDSRAQMIAALLLGPISVILNLYCHRRIDGASGFSAHLLSDMIGGAVVAISGPLSFIASRPSWNFRGGIVILALTTVVAIITSLQIAKRIKHRAHDHPTENQQHHHHAH